MLNFHVSVERPHSSPFASECACPCLEGDAAAQSAVEEISRVAAFLP